MIHRIPLNPRERARIASLEKAADVAQAAVRAALLLMLDRAEIDEETFVSATIDGDALAVTTQDAAPSEPTRAIHDGPVNDP